MKSRQEKRVNAHHNSQAAEEKSQSEAMSVLQSVKLKPTGLSQTLKSPTDSTATEESNLHASTTSVITSSPGSPQLDPGGRLTPSLKSKPPPIAPKP
ncbi:hypothetical protein X975_22684, partial [Stegodyphus mimosarum]